MVVKDLTRKEKINIRRDIIYFFFPFVFKHVTYKINMQYGTVVVCTSLV